MGDALFGLSSESRTILDQYMQWTRLAREGLKRGIHLDASNHQVGNVLQETYTRDELKEILSGLTAVLLHSVDASMERFATSSAELLHAVLKDADRQRVALEVDVNNVLSAAAPKNPAGTATTASDGLFLDHQRQLLNGPRGRLAPLTVADAGGEASRQLAESGEEIRRLQEKVRRLTDAYAQVMNMRSVDTEQLLAMHDALKTSDATAAAAMQMAQHQKEKDEGLHHSMEELRSALAAAKKELNTRLNQSTQYQEVKRILAQKNEQIRMLRAQLAQYNPAFLQTDSGGGDTIIEEDD